jgi:hypothetical protein
MIRHHHPRPEFIECPLACAFLERFRDEIGYVGLIQPSRSEGLAVERAVCRDERSSRRTIGASWLGLRRKRIPQPPGHEHECGAWVEMRQTPPVFVQAQNLLLVASKKCAQLILLLMKDVENLPRLARVLEHSGKAGENACPTRASICSKKPHHTSETWTSDQSGLQHGSATRAIPSPPS